MLWKRDENLHKILIFENSCLIFILFHLFWQAVFLISLSSTLQISEVSNLVSNQKMAAFEFPEPALLQENDRKMSYKVSLFWYTNCLCFDRSPETGIFGIPFRFFVDFLAFSSTISVSVGKSYENKEILLQKWEDPFGKPISKQPCYE